MIDVIYILLHLGTAPNCEHQGICRMEPIIEAKPERNCEQCVVAYVGPSENGIALAIPEKSIPDKLFLKHFTKDYFELVVDFTLPDDLCDKVGVPKGFIFKKGKYPINESQSDIVLFFKP